MYPSFNKLDLEEENYEEGRQEMRTAIVQGDLSRVKKILSEGYPIDLPLNDVKTTAMHLACNRGKSEILKYLISYNGKINVKDKRDWTPLILAASCGELDCVIILLKERNIDITAKGLEGKDALKFAEQRLIDARMQNQVEESDKYAKIISAIKRKLQ